MLCRGHYVSLFTLNGELILEQNVCIECDDAVLSCAFYEGLGNEYLERDLIFTGHRRGVVNVNLQGLLLVDAHTDIHVGLEQSNSGRRVCSRARQTNASSRSGRVQCECSYDLCAAHGADGVYR